MAPWFWYAVVAAVLYGAHQIFTRMAADHIGEGLADSLSKRRPLWSILVYLAFLWLASRWNQQSSVQGISIPFSLASALARHNCVLSTFSKRRSTLVCFQLFWLAAQLSWPSQEFCFFHESPSWQHLLGVAFAIVGLFLLRR